MSQNNSNNNNTKSRSGASNNNNHNNMMLPQPQQQQTSTFNATPSEVSMKERTSPGNSSAATPNTSHPPQFLSRHPQNQNHQRTSSTGNNSSGPQSYGSASNAIQAVAGRSRIIPTASTSNNANNQQQQQQHLQSSADTASRDEGEFFEDDALQDREEFQKEFLKIAKANDLNVKKLLRTAARQRNVNLLGNQRSNSSQHHMTPNTNVGAAAVSLSMNNQQQQQQQQGSGNASPQYSPNISASTHAYDVNNTNNINASTTALVSSSTNNNNLHQAQRKNNSALSENSDNTTTNNNNNNTAVNAAASAAANNARLTAAQLNRLQPNQKLPKARVVHVDLSDLIHKDSTLGGEEDDDDDDDDEEETTKNNNRNGNYDYFSPFSDRDDQGPYGPSNNTVDQINNDGGGGPVLSTMSAGGFSQSSSHYSKTHGKGAQQDNRSEHDALLPHHHDNGKQQKKKKRGVKFQTGEELHKVVFYEVDNSIYLRIEYRRPIFGWLCLVVALLAQSAQLTCENYFHYESISPYASAMWTSLGQMIAITLLCAAYLGACYTGQGIYHLLRYSVMMQIAVAALMYTLVGIARQACAQFSHTSRQLTATAVHPFLIAIFGLVFRNTVFYEEIAGIVVFIVGFALTALKRDTTLHLWGFAEIVALANAIYTASMLFTLVKARSSSVPVPILAFCCSLMMFIAQCIVAPAATSPYANDLQYSFVGFTKDKRHLIGFFLSTLCSTSALLAFIKALQFLPPITVSVAIALSPVLATFEMPILPNIPANITPASIFDIYFCVGAFLSVSSAIYVLYISSIKRQRVDMLMRSLSRRRKPKDPYNRNGTNQQQQQQGFLTEEEVQQRLMYDEQQHQQLQQSDQQHQLYGDENVGERNIGSETSSPSSLIHSDHHHHNNGIKSPANRSSSSLHQHHHHHHHHHDSSNDSSNSNSGGMVGGGASSSSNQNIMIVNPNRSPSSSSHKTNSTEQYYEEDGSTKKAFPIPQQQQSKDDGSVNSSFGGGNVNTRFSINQQKSPSPSSLRHRRSGLGVVSLSGVGLSSDGGGAGGSGLGSRRNSVLTPTAGGIIINGNGKLPQRRRDYVALNQQLTTERSQSELSQDNNNGSFTTTPSTMTGDQNTHLIHIPSASSQNSSSITTEQQQHQQLLIASGASMDPNSSSLRFPQSPPMQSQQQQYYSLQQQQYSLNRTATASSINSGSMNPHPTPAAMNPSEPSPATLTQSEYVHAQQQQLQQRNSSSSTNLARNGHSNNNRINTPSSLSNNSYSLSNLAAANQQQQQQQTAQKIRESTLSGVSVDDASEGNNSSSTASFHGDARNSTLSRSSGNSYTIENHLHHQQQQQQQYNSVRTPPVTMAQQQRTATSGSTGSRGSASNSSSGKRRGSDVRRSGGKSGGGAARMDD